MYEISKKISIGIERYTSYSTKCLDRKREGAMCMKVREEASGPCISRPSILHDPKQHQIKHGWKVIYCYKLTNQLEKRVILQEHSRYYLQHFTTLHYPLRRGYPRCCNEILLNSTILGANKQQKMPPVPLQRFRRKESQPEILHIMTLVSHGSWSQLFEKLGKGHQSYPFLNSLMENTI